MDLFKLGQVTEERETSVSMVAPVELSLDGACGSRQMSSTWLEEQDKVAGIWGHHIPLGLGEHLYKVLTSIFSWFLEPSYIAP